MYWERGVHCERSWCIGLVETRNCVNPLHSSIAFVKQATANLMIEAKNSQGSTSLGRRVAVAPNGNLSSCQTMEIDFVVILLNSTGSRVGDGLQIELLTRWLASEKNTFDFDSHTHLKNTCLYQ